MLLEINIKPSPAPRAFMSPFITHPYAPSVASLRDLKKVMIKDLNVETHHRGSYVLLRAVTPPKAMIANMVIAEDEDKNVLVLHLFNQGKELATDGRLIEGTVMIVKEPYLKLLSVGDYAITVDHPSDVRILSRHDSLLPPAWRSNVENPDLSANDLKAKGNEAFKKAEYHFAIEQ